MSTTTASALSLLARLRRAARRASHERGMFYLRANAARRERAFVEQHVSVDDRQNAESVRPGHRDACRRDHEPDLGPRGPESSHRLVAAERAKSGRARAVPLNDDAMAVLHNRRGKHYDLVFCRASGRPVAQPDRRTFLAACKAAGLVGFRFHDLRHTWASWHVQSGTPLFALKELGGWETLEMVKKYAHLGAEHLVGYVNNVTFTAQLAQKQKAAQEIERLSA